MIRAAGNGTAPHRLGRRARSGLCATESIARAISNDGIVVGHAGAPGTADFNEAIVWSLPQGVKVCRLGFLTEEEGAWSTAYGVNDYDPPLVVGDALVAHPMPGQPCSQVNLGFWAQVDLSGPGCPQVTLKALDPVPPDNSSYARAANTSGEMVGISNGPENIGCFSPLCNPGEDAVRWDPGVEALTPVEDSLGGQRARAVNSGGEIVGSGFDADAAPCTRLAGFWKDYLSAPFVLGTVMPPGQEFDASHATGLNDLPLTQVVGWNDDRQLGLLWQRQQPPPVDDDWIVRLLDDEIPCGDNWSVKQAHSISASGWIAAVAEANPPSGDLYAAVLRPIDTCLWDISSTQHGPPDDVVGVNDFQDLLWVWGSCAIGQICDADFDCSGDVGINDFLALLAHWGPCPESGAAEPPSLEQVVEEAGLQYPEDWDAFVDAMTDPELSEAEKANWRCWMDHYLDCHRRPFCFECACQICPDADPYGNH